MITWVWCHIYDDMKMVTYLWLSGYGTISMMSKVIFFSLQNFWSLCRQKSPRGSPAQHLNEPAGGSCCGAGLGLVWYCCCVFLKFVCLTPKKGICFGLLRGWGYVESKNKISAKRKSTMSSLDPSIIQVASFKCRADVPLRAEDGGSRNQTFTKTF